LYEHVMAKCACSGCCYNGDARVEGLQVVCAARSTFVWMFGAEREVSLICYSLMLFRDYLFLVKWPVCEFWPGVSEVLARAGGGFGDCGPLAAALPVAGSFPWMLHGCSGAALAPGGGKGPFVTSLEWDLDLHVCSEVKSLAFSPLQHLQSQTLVSKPKAAPCLLQLWMRGCSLRRGSHRITESQN